MEARLLLQSPAHKSIMQRDLVCFLRYLIFALLRSGLIITVACRKGILARPWIGDEQKCRSFDS